MIKLKNIRISVDCIKSYKSLDYLVFGVIKLYVNGNESFGSDEINVYYNNRIEMDDDLSKLDKLLLK